MFHIFILVLPGVSMSWQGLSLLRLHFMILTLIPELFPGLYFCNLFPFLNLFLNMLRPDPHFQHLGLGLRLTLHESRVGLSSIEQFIVDII